MIEKQDPCCLKDITHPPTTVLIYVHVYNSLYIHNHSREQTNHLKMPKWTRDTKIILIFWNRALVEIQSNYQDCGVVPPMQRMDRVLYGQGHLYVWLPAPLTREYTLCELSYQINYILFQQRFSLYPQIQGQGNLKRVETAIFVKINEIFGVFCIMIHMFCKLFCWRR